MYIICLSSCLIPLNIGNFSNLVTSKIKLLDDKYTRKQQIEDECTDIIFLEFCYESKHIFGVISEYRIFQNK